MHKFNFFHSRSQISDIIIHFSCKDEKTDNEKTDYYYIVNNNRKLLAVYFTSSKKLFRHQKQ